MTARAENYNRSIGKDKERVGAYFFCSAFFFLPSTLSLSPYHPLSLLEKIMINTGSLLLLVLILIRTDRCTQTSSKIENKGAWV